jgi:hypothetical protein
MELPAKYSSGRVQKPCEYNFASNQSIGCQSNIGASTYRRSGLLSAATETTLSDIDARTSYDIFLMQGLRIVSDRIPYKVVFNGIPPRRYASAQPNTAAKRKILISSQLHLYNWECTPVFDHQNGSFVTDKRQMYRPSFSRNICSLEYNWNEIDALRICLQSQFKI